MADRLSDLIFNEAINSLDETIESEIRKSFKISMCVENTHIYVLALNNSNNKLLPIDYKDRCIPMMGCVYDVKFEKFYVECVEHLDLGTISVSFSIKIDKISRWETRIPVSEKVIMNYLNKQQIKNLDIFKSRNKDCQFEFMQLISCY